MATRTELLGIARELGHASEGLWQQRGRELYFTRCVCGYESTLRATPVDALGALLHHHVTAARAVQKKAQSSGRPIGALILKERVAPHSAGAYSRKGDRVA